MRQIIDHKSVDMTDEEFAYYKRLVVEFTVGTSSGAEQFRDLFDVDVDGCITLIRPPIRKQIGWGVLFFMQNLMINQRLRRMEDRIREWTRQPDGGRNG
jgi:hypothetical protein